MAKATLEIGGKETMAAVIDKLNSKIDQMGDKLQKVSADSKKGTDKAAEGFEGLTSKISGAVTAYASVETAIRLMNLEAERAIELQNKAMDAASRVGNPQRNYLANYQPADSQKAEAAMNAMSRSTGRDVADLYSAMNIAKPSMALLSPAQQMEALQQSAAFSRTAEGMGGSLKSVGNMMSTGMTAEQAAGFLIKTTKLSGSSLDNVQNRLTPEALSMMGLGASRNDAGSVLSAFSADPEFSRRRGDMGVASTAGKLTQSLMHDYPTTDTPEYDEHGRRKGMIRGTGMTSLAERIMRLQGDPKELDKYMSRSHYGPDEEGAVRSLLTSGTGMAKRFGSNMFEYLRPTDTKGFFKNLDATTVQRTENIGSRLGSEATQAGLDNSYAAGQGQARKLYETFLDRSGAGVEKWLRMFAYDRTPGNGPDYVQGQIRGFENGAEGPLDSAARGVGGQLPSKALRGHDRDPYDAMIKELQGIRANQSRPVTPNSHNE